MTDASRLTEQIDRLTRLVAARDRNELLNPAQHQALAYLARANRFSRAPSHVAEYLSTTRGTASQTLKALERKGCIAQSPAGADKRSISYDVTQAGYDALDAAGDLQSTLKALPASERAGLSEGVQALLRQLLQERGQRSFGLCRTCRHHDTTNPSGRVWCRLLNIELAPDEGDALCHEHAAISGTA